MDGLYHCLEYISTGFFRDVLLQTYVCSFTISIVIVVGSEDSPRCSDIYQTTHTTMHNTASKSPRYYLGPARTRWLQISHVDRRSFYIIISFPHQLKSCKAMKSRMIPTRNTPLDSYLQVSKLRERRGLQMFNRSDLLYSQLQENLHKPLRDAVYYVELYPEYQILSTTDNYLYDLQQLITLHLPRSITTVG